MTEFYQSLVCKNNKLIGEEIARLEVNLKSWKYIKYVNMKISQN